LQPSLVERQPLYAQEDAALRDIDYFVRVEGPDFVVGPDCKRLYLSGWNMWESMEAAAGALHLFGASLPEGSSGPALIRTKLDRAKAKGLSLLRTWAHPVSERYALSKQPGVYNEAMFRGLDYLLDEARKRSIRVTLAITDFWQAAGGALQYMNWAGGADVEDFFFLPEARRLYKNHMEVLLNRINSINGRQYKEDPTWVVAFFPSLWLALEIINY
jgi:mannan endo-1,4-beta-mannosidase